MQFAWTGKNTLQASISKNTIVAYKPNILLTALLEYINVLLCT